MGHERVPGGRVIHQAGCHQAVRLAPERFGDPPVRLALRAGGPVAAAQRQDGGGDRARGLVEGVRGGRDRGAIPHPDDRAVTDRRTQDLGGQPTDHPPGQVLGSHDGRGEMDGVQAIAASKGVGGRAGGAGGVDDPDLDDALGARTLEEFRDLRPRDTHLLGDRVLRLTQLVVQAADADELLEIAHEGSFAR